MARAHPPIIAIIGLGPVGSALGRALAHIRTDYRLVGHDRDAARAKAAMAAGAIDEARWNLIAAVEDADLIVLTEPLDQSLRTIEHIAPHVRPGSLVTDTTPVMRPMLRAAAVLPPGVSFISGHPILAGRLVAADAEAAASAAADTAPAASAAAATHPAASDVAESAPAARAATDSAADRATGPLREGGPNSLFAGIVYCVVPAASADAAALRVLTDLIAAIGAEPYFIDAQEHDALVTAVDQLPHLAGAALARVLGHSPSAADIGRLMPPSMRTTWLAPGRDGADTAAATMEDPSAVLAWLDAFARELAELRTRVAHADADAIAAWLAEADAARTQLAPAGRRGREGDGVDQDAAWDDIGSVNPLRGLLLGRRRGR